jgi:hypothetical protein
MAKRGYRGKHPHNDMKVSKNPSSNKYSAKLTTEYKKLKNNKQKYEYIKTHYYYPQSTCTLTVVGNPTEDKNLVLTSTDGTTVTYIATGSQDLTANAFKRLDPSGSLATVINSGHEGKIVATATPGQVILTQQEPGPDGDTLVSGSTNLISASGQSGAISTNGSFSF